MSIILAHFVHWECHLRGCNACDAIDFGYYYIHGGSNGKTALRNILSAAVQKHHDKNHPANVPTIVTACHFVWKDNGHGSDLLDMDENMLRAQFELAWTRGRVDHIQIEFSAPQ
ncbi:hypothetical protein F4679DRAFT_589993 [Xylaria curta]|nr:hypothetical protein F4679DRAFT_589993 [Xylaria curta]